MKIGTIIITKELFIETIEIIKKQTEFDNRCSDAFGVILPNDFISGYDNSLITNQLLKLIKIPFNDDNGDSWIDYFIWELGFGDTYSEEIGRAHV